VVSLLCWWGVLEIVFLVETLGDAFVSLVDLFVLTLPMVFFDLTGRFEAGLFFPAFAMYIIQAFAECEVSE
jgi:hypothetical protein